MMRVLEAVVRRCSVKKVFLEISQNSQENTCVRVSFLIKLQAAPLVAASGVWRMRVNISDAKDFLVKIR